MPKPEFSLSGEAHSVTIVPSRRYHDGVDESYVVYGVYCTCSWRQEPTPHKHKADQAAAEHVERYYPKKDE